MIRNYLLKTVVYKLKNRFIEVQINQSNLYICFLKAVKQFDLQNKLKIRKGYENTSLSYYLRVEDINNLEYAFELAKELYDYLLSRNFSFFLYPENNFNDDYEIYAYVDEISTIKEEKAIHLIYILAELENRTTSYKEYTLDEI